QGQSYAGNSYKGNATSLRGNNTGWQARVVKCYKYQAEGHMARQCTQPKRPRNVAWFKEKAMLAEAYEAGQILDEEQLAFLADLGIPDAILMANISSNGFDVLSEVPHSDSYHNDMDNQSVHAMQDFEQTPVVDFSNNEIHSDNHIILYSQYLQETQLGSVQDINMHVQQDSIILSMIEQMSEPMINYVNNWEKVNQERNNETLTAELKRYKERVNTFEQRLNIDLSTPLGYQNLFNLKKAQRIKPTLYDGSVISKQHVASPMFDDDETLILEEVSRSKMLAKQNDPILKEKKVNTTPINYAELNRLSKDFGKCFVPQQELSDEQAFWLQTSHPNTNQSALSPFKIEAPRVLPKCMDLEAELLNKQSVYNNLSKEYFENNDLKAQLQSKDTTIYKLKEHIKSMRENVKEEKVKHEMGKIETINIELEHSVAKLISENDRLHKEIKHLKKIYEDQFDSIKKTRALSMEHDDSLIGQLNSKSMENADLKRQIQDKIDLEPLAPRLLNNREAYIDYLKHTQEHADILQGIVKQAKAKQPLDNALDFACKHAKRI
ncbi:hypothetical protein Tco_1075996, partial [Tanacetum coccineum]